MKRTISTHIHRTIVMLFACTLLISCDRQTRITKDFVWDEDVKARTGRSLHAWLKKAPFDNEFGKGDGNNMVFTNAEQVFPFMGRYYNAVEELTRDHSTDTVIFQDTKILFRDSVFIPADYPSYPVFYRGKLQHVTFSPALHQLGSWRCFPEI
ncbi:hypothetical protein [Parapedobacter sp. 10938]|uniref:hypothetical protein n=1 Tax=Parapedobacter flavus TaxID=3110225 RepID=UPI002DBFD00B|nr:hypothetical protein [Parapedobacter sp. 10938]MEC3879364.1 hypothetical protein [Parapedobacter sp. 10938]